MSRPIFMPAAGGRSGQHGFGLIELLAIVVVVGVLAAVAMQSMTSVIQDARTVRTRAEMEALACAIIGDPALTNGGTRSDFGYVGDVGSFPANLQALYQNPGGYATWDGPYLASDIVQDSTGFRFDEWGRSYDYSGGTTIRSTGSGEVIERQVVRATSDYLLNNFTGTVLDAAGNEPGVPCAGSVVAMLSVPNGLGGTRNVHAFPDSLGKFAFDSLPVGLHPLNIIFVPNVDTIRTFLTILPRHRSTRSYRFTSDHFSACGSAAVIDTIDVRVAQDADDAEEDPAGNPYVANHPIMLGQMEWVGVRFVGVNIPNGATIIAAYVEFSAAADNAEVTNLLVWGQSDDNSAQFAGDIGNLSNRPRTSASASWNNVPSWTTGSVYATPGLGGVIQEIVDRPGWTSGNALVLLIESSSSSGQRRLDSHDGQPATAPVLHVVYTTVP